MINKEEMYLSSPPYNATSTSCLSISSHLVDSPMSLLSKAASSPEIQHIHIFQLASFVATCQEMKPVIEQGWRERGNSHDSDTLPIDVVNYLCRHLRMSVMDVQSCWALYKNDISQPQIEDDIHRDLMAHTYTMYSSVVELRKLGLGETPFQISLLFKSPDM